MKHPLLAIASVMGLLGVLAGTFGAHGLDKTLSAEMLKVFETGARYHMYHVLALCVTAWAGSLTDRRWATAAGTFFTAGIIVFSGSLYTLAITGVRWLGMITPVGGVCFILGWFFLFLSAVSVSKGNQQPS